MRGELASADSQFVAVGVEAERHELTRELAMATHNRAVVASRAGNATDAVLLAHQALKHTHDGIERDRVLGDLAAFLIKTGRYDAALDALRILEITASSEEPRVQARVNVIIVSARTGNRALFDSALAEIPHESLLVDARVNLFIEIAKAQARFGDPAKAESSLLIAERDAGAHGLAGSLAEIAALRRDGDLSVNTLRLDERVEHLTSGVAADLRQMAAAVAA